MQNLLDKVLSKLSISNLTGIKDKGPHPVHGSKNGNNTTINELDNTWYCFRHQAGGGPLQWIAIQHFGVSCEQATNYTKSNFQEVLKKACEITNVEYVDYRDNTTHNTIHIDAYPFNAIPLKGESKYEARPAVKWTDYQKKRYPMDKSDDRSQLIVTGAVDTTINPLVVIDIDIQKNTTATQKEITQLLQLLQLPKTYTVKSPSGGYHLYYLLPKQKSIDKIPTNKAIVLDTAIINRYPQLSIVKEIDIRGQGGIIYAPPTEWTEIKHETDILGKYESIGYEYLAIISKKKFNDTLNFFSYEPGQCDHKVEDLRLDLISYLDNELNTKQPHYIIEKLKKLYYYKHGYYNIDTDDDWLTGCGRAYIDRNYPCCKNKFSSNQIQNSIDIHLERLVKNKKEGSYFDKAVIHDGDYLYFNFLNNVVRIDINPETESEYKILPHNPDFKFSSQLQVKFIEDPDPQYWLDKIHGSIPENQKMYDISDRQLFLYYLAYSLVPDFSWKTSMYLHGPANTGKTTLIKNFSKVFERVAKTNLGQLNSDTFALQNLPFADFWFSNEVDVKTVKSDMFKQIVEGGEMEFRIMHGSIETKADFKTVITGNNLITLTDEAIAYRLMPIKFSVRHDRDQTNKIDDLLQENLPDFISFIIQNYVPAYYKRIGTLTKLQNERTYEYYNINEEPFINGFVRDYVSPCDPNSNTYEKFEYATQNIVDMYNDWAISNGFPKMSLQQISQRIGNMAKDEEVPFQFAKKAENITYGDSKRLRGWTNIHIKYEIQLDEFKVDNLNEDFMGTKGSNAKISGKKQISEYDQPVLDDFY